MASLRCGELGRRQAVSQQPLKLSSLVRIQAPQQIERKIRNTKSEIFSNLRSVGSNGRNKSENLNKKSKKTASKIKIIFFSPSGKQFTNVMAESFKKYTDMIQIGSRNMHNFDLLKKVAKLNKPILLKRGMSATIEELLMSAEYIVSEGNRNVILCEGGLRTICKYTRNRRGKSLSH